MRSWQKLAIALAVLLGATYVIIRFVFPLFLPFLLALLFAALIDPIVNRAEERFPRLNRGWLTFAAIILVLVIVMVFLVLGVSQIYLELKDLLASLPEYQKDVNRLFLEWESRWRFISRRLPDSVLNAIAASQGRLYARVEDWAKAAVGMVAGLPSFLLLLVVSFVATYFIVRDHKKITNGVFRVLPPHWRASGRVIQRETVGAVAGWLRTQVIVMTLTTLVTLVGLFILRVKYAVLLAALTGLAELLPMVGPSTIFLPWIAYELLIGNYLFALLLGLILAVMTVLRQVVEPKLLGSQLRLHPLGALLALYLGFRLFGVIGLVLGPIVAVILRAVIQTLILPRFPL